jgi:hypothetical protein
MKDLMLVTALIFATCSEESTWTGLQEKMVSIDCLVVTLRSSIRPF